MKTGSNGFLELLPFPNKKMVNADPPIYIVENFLSHAECQQIIKMSEKDVQVSHVVDSSTGQGVPHPSRTSHSCYHGYELKWLVNRVKRLTGVSQQFQEPTQVARYHTGQFYQSHQDAFDGTPDSQRIGTVLMYLNNVAKGGGTLFNNLNIRVQPKEGTALIFFPATMDGKLDSRYLHTAENASDIKWVSQVWLRNKQYSS